MVNEGRRKWGGFRGHYIFVEYSNKSILTHKNAFNHVGASRRREKMGGFVLIYAQFSGI